MPTAFKTASLLAALTGGLLLTAPAGAAVIGLPPMDGFASFTSTTPGTFEDFVQFQVTGPRQSGAIILNALGLQGVTGVAFSAAGLYSGTFSDRSQLTTAVPILATSSTQLTDSLTLNTAYAATQALAPGAYTLYVSGQNTTSAYTGIIQLAPVPEPETYAMLLAGLGVMGAIARRRRRSV